MERFIRNRVRFDRFLVRRSLRDQRGHRALWVVAPR
jgi:hypothetical protein